MRPSDISLKFALAFVLMAAGAAPIALSLDGLSRAILAFERHRAAFPPAFAANSGGVTTASFLVLACVLAFAAGLTLAIVAFGRTLDHLQAMSGSRPRPLRF